MHATRGRLLVPVCLPGVTPTTFIMPAVLWLTLRRPARAAWWGNVAIITACVAVGVLGTVASLRLIVRHASQYSLFAA